jgi:hypothetical protein
LKTAGSAAGLQSVLAKAEVLEATRARKPAWGIAMKTC